MRFSIFGQPNLIDDSFEHMRHATENVHHLDYYRINNKYVIYCSYRYTGFSFKLPAAFSFFQFPKIVVILLSLSLFLSVAMVFVLVKLF
jgi:hypothetical protein